MKNWLILTVLIASTSFAHAQEVAKDSSSKEYKLRTGKGKNMRVIIQKEGKNDTLDIDGPDSRKIMVITGKDKGEEQDSIYFEMPRKRTKKSRKKSVSRNSFYFDFGWNALMNK